MPGNCLKHPEAMNCKIWWTRYRVLAMASVVKIPSAFRFETPVATLTGITINRIIARGACFFIILSQFMEL
jgi:hypothetical protein